MERALALALRAFSEVMTRFLADLMLAKINSFEPFAAVRMNPVNSLHTGRRKDASPV
jgi:hypothetical protein